MLLFASICRVGGNLLTMTAVFKESSVLIPDHIVPPIRQLGALIIIIDTLSDGSVLYDNFSVL